MHARRATTSLCMLLLAILLSGCFLTVEAEVTLTVLYSADQGHPAPGGGPNPSLSLELMSPVNCVEVGAEVSLTLTIKNTQPHSITLDALHPLDIIIAEGTIEHRWSQSPEYPRDLPLVVEPGAELTLRWGWRAELLEEVEVGVAASVDVTVSLSSAPTSDTSIYYRQSVGFTVYIGSMPATDADAPPITCADALRNTWEARATKEAASEADWDD